MQPHNGTGGTGHGLFARSGILASETSAGVHRLTAII
jgi:hypothetical protein